MSDTKHTPGPWSAYRGAADWGMPGMDEIMAGGEPIAAVYFNQPYCIGASRKEIAERAQAWANAKLIEAAPDLLAALEAAIDCGMVPTSSAKEGGASAAARQVHVADQIRAAIAKATESKP